MWNNTQYISQIWPWNLGEQKFDFLEGPQMLKQLVATFECFNNVFKGFPKVGICILHTLHILFILPNPSHWGAASERNFPGKGGLQTWNLSNKFTRPNFWTTKFTLSKRVNCDYFCQWYNSVDFNINDFGPFLLKLTYKCKVSIVLYKRCV